MITEIRESRTSLLHKYEHHPRRHRRHHTLDNSTLDKFNFICVPLNLNKVNNSINLVFKTIIANRIEMILHHLNRVFLLNLQMNYHLLRVVFVLNLMKIKRKIQFHLKNIQFIVLNFKFLFIEV